MKLHNWSVQFERTLGSEQRYMAPELVARCIVGDVEGHPSRPDGETVITSRIISVEGRTVTTRSGSVYTLGKIAPSYRKYLRTVSPDWDHRKPIKVHE